MILKLFAVNLCVTGKGFLEESVWVPCYYSVYTVHRGLYFPMLCIINFIFQADL